MGEPMLALSDVTYTVGGRDLVSGIDLAVMAGELVALIGPNGAGKSTLHRIASGELAPTRGTAAILGRDLSLLSGHELSLLRAALSQPIPVDVPFLARSIVEMGRFPHRHEQGNSPETDEDEVRRAMERTMVMDLGQRVYSTLSGGERTRVFMAQVLAQGSQLVLLDEPTTSLDVGHSEKTMGVVAALAAEGKAVVAVLHDLNAAARHAARVVVMDRGRIVVAGPPTEVLTGEVLSDVYRHPMKVTRDPTTGELLILAERSQPV